MSKKCQECGAEFPSIESLRGHYLGKKDHTYQPDQFERVYEDGNQGDNGSTEEEKEGTGGGGEADTVGETPSSPDTTTTDEEMPSRSGGEDTIDLSSYVEGTPEDEEQKEKVEDGGRVGLGQAVNNVYGTVFSLEPDEDGDWVPDDGKKETFNQLAEDVGLGQNVAHWYKEEIQAEPGEVDPQRAMIGSLVLALVLGLAQRPEYVHKLRDKAQNTETGNENEADE